MMGKLPRRSLFVISAILLSALTGQQVYADNALQIEAMGPGNRILGLDISKYQHTKNQPIDFTVNFCSLRENPVFQNYQEQYERHRAV